MGGHLDVCAKCGHQAPSYNSCRNRHCPKCQCLTQARWLEQRRQRIVPTKYFHVVFTLPQELRGLARANPKEMYDLVLESAARTLLDFGRSRLQAQLGVTTVLHTWTRELRFQENGSTYDPVRHQRALEGLRPSRAGDGQPTPAERVAANVRRLERLARYRLATRLPDGRWQIPADLLSQLEERERTHPQHRLRFEKLGGPTREPGRPRAQDVASELDTFEASSSSATMLAACYAKAPASGPCGAHASEPGCDGSDGTC